jgi:predicted ferric reductase
LTCSPRSLFLAIIHAIAHIVNYSLDGTEAALELLFTTERDQGWVAGLAGLTGIIALAIFLVLGLASMSCVRRSRHFEAFYWTHKLYAPLLVLLILHAPLMWKFLIGALVLHGIELIALAKNSSTATVIERVSEAVLPRVSLSFPSLLLIDCFSAGCRASRRHDQADDSQTASLQLPPRRVRVHPHPRAGPL